MTIQYHLPHELYLRQLRRLGAWWCLGSSAVASWLLTQYAPVSLRAARPVG